MAIARSTAETMDTITTRLRRELRDPATDPAGNAQLTGALKYQSAELYEYIQDELIRLNSLLELVHEGNAILSASLTYSETANTGQGVSLPSGIDMEPIFMVEDISSSDSTPRPVQYVTPREIERFQDPLLRANPNDVLGPQYYTLLGDATGYRIKIRPQPPSDRVYRVWYLAAPFVPGVGGDSVWLSKRWADLIALGAALKILRRTPDGTTMEQRVQYQAELTLFQQFADRVKEPDMVRPVRGRSI